MGVRKINLHQISGNSINAFLSLCHQFYRPIIIRKAFGKHMLVILNFKKYALIGNGIRLSLLLFSVPFYSVLL